MTTILAKSILASRHSLDPKLRIDTLECDLPRSILAELLTHRVFSRNTSSSRAIPVKKMIERVMTDPFIPVSWGSNQKGMQAGKECLMEVELYSPEFGLSECYDRETAWLCARDQAVMFAKAFAKAGYHKQIVNRLLEPWMWVKVVITSTQWSNFLALRDHPGAEPHIQILAQRVTEALESAQVEILEPGVWHLPFVKAEEHNLYDLEWLKKLSVTRCASTSYKTVEGFDMTLEQATRIYDKLLGLPMHASPFEHQAQATRPLGERGWLNSHLSGNLGPGWVQLRKTIPGECS